ncbi:MAG: SurA N-terminal domain-containing protein [Candidatus Omnitrophica bacterium]|nr:SurA N-terminal domain-containing protein [Candidatus Omnitrophota bacterium]
MLKILRKKGIAKKILWVVAVVIIISFGFFGTAYLLTGKGVVGYAGKIFGKKVSLEDFDNVYQETRMQAIRQYGADLDKVAHLLNLEAQTWDRMILLHEAKKRRIHISNEQVVQAIRQDPSFQRNGRFDVLIYNAILRTLRIRARDYEETMRDNLKISELYRQATSSVTISEEEVFEEYKKRNEKIQISYVLVSPESFKDEITANADQIKQYYEDHKAEFRMPPTIDVRYLTFAFPEEIKKNEKLVTETAVEAGQENNDESGEETSAEEGQKENGNAGTESPADENEQEIAREKEIDVIREKADAVFQELLINPNMEEVAGKNNLTVENTGFFSMEQPNLTAGWSYDILNDLFQMDVNEISEPYETADGITILQIKENRESYTPEFQEAKEKAQEAVIEKEAGKIAEQKAAENLKAIKEELNKSKLQDFPKAAKDLGLKIDQTPTFNRGQYLPQIGISKEFQEAAFALTEDNKVSEVVETAKGYCILHLDDYVPIENSDYEKAKDALAQELSDEKRNAAFADFVSQLRIKANLIDHLPELRARFQ